MSISIHDGKIQIDGVADMVAEQLDRVIQVLDSLPNVPPDVRERVKNRVKAVRGKVASRLGKLKTLDLDKIGPEMERMGDEIEREMEGLDRDLSQLGDSLGEKLGKDFADKFGKDFAKSFKNTHVAPSHDADSDDDDDDDDEEDKAAVALPPLPDGVDPDTIGDLKKQVALNQKQKDELAKLRAESERKIEAAKRDLESMSNRLQDTLARPNADEGEVERLIDQISNKEAAIRKARVLAWVKARKLLGDDQRKQVEAAARRSH
jgi:Spy/CpxP family protein refolding chaperone